MAQIVNNQEPELRKKKTQTYVYIAFFLIAVALALVFILKRYPGLLTIFTDQPKIRSFIAKFGMRAPFILIGLQVFQIIFAPIPGHFVGFASGYLFGMVNGTIYCLIGIVIGGSIAFWIGRFFGRRVLKMFISHEKMERFDQYVLHRGPFIIFLLLLIPFGPLGDFIYYLSGITPIPFLAYLAIVLITRLPNNFVYNLIGAKAFSFSSREWIIFGIVLVILAVIFYFNQKRIERLLSRYVKIGE